MEFQNILLIQVNPSIEEGWKVKSGRTHFLSIQLDFETLWLVFKNIF